jgi:hypothetical protein
MSTITGRCLCGNVSWRASAGPITTRVCWCRLCQAIGAGSATVNACFRVEDVAIEGEVSDYESVADSGARMHRRFCPRCGVHLFSEAEPRPHLIFIRVGTMDDREAVRPEATIWTREAPSWACIAEDIPRLEGQAPPAA